MLPINNAANSLGLGSKKYSQHFTPNASDSTILIGFIIFFVNIKKRKKYILNIKSIKTGEKNKNLRKL